MGRDAGQEGQEVCVEGLPLSCGSVEFTMPSGVADVMSPKWKERSFGNLGLNTHMRAGKHLS